MEILDAKELSAYIKIPEATIRQWTSKKRIPHIKVPGSSHVRYIKGEIDEWMQQGRRAVENGKALEAENPGE